MNNKTDFFDENFYKLIDLVGATIYWKDKEGRYLGCNRHLLEQFGLKSSKELIGKNDYEALLVPEHEVPQLVENDKFALEHGIFEGEEYATICGQQITYLTKKISVLNKKGEVAGIIGTSLDITNQKKLLELERKKIISDEQLKITQIIDAVNAAIYWKDKQGHYLGCNKYVLGMVGLSDRSQLIGKTDEDLSWKPEAATLKKIDSDVVKYGSYVGEEDATLANGSKATVFTVKNQLLDSDGNVVGIIGTSLDITAQKEAEKLREERQQALLREQEKLIALAHKVAHDISSPLSALNMMIQLCNELPENKRSVIKRANESILDIANNLLSTYRNEQAATAGIETRQPVLVSDLIGQLLSEKKAQYSNHSVKFTIDITDGAQFAFALLQTSQFHRSLSNLINNAVDAVSSSDTGKVTIKLSSGNEFVTVAIQDNGKGMPSSLIEKIVRRQAFTEGKQQGHGLGLQQVWDTLDHNQGTILVHSTQGQGTIIQLTFPRIAAPDWFAETLSLAPDSIIVILDDEESIHGAWDTLFFPYLQRYPHLSARHFKQGRDALDFFSKLVPLHKNRIIFLSDYELLRQDKNGLQIIEESGIKNTILVTSYYANLPVRDKAIALGVKTLPKQMASIIPIEVK